MNRAILIGIILSILCIGIASAGIGEISGQFSYAIQQGGSQSTIWVLTNTNYTAPLQFYIEPANLTSGVVNPSIIYSPMNGTIPPNGIFIVRVIMQMPLNAPLNKTWSGYATAMPNANGNSGGEQIQVGTAKLITLTATPAPTTTTTSINPTTTISNNNGGGGVLQSSGGNPGTTSTIPQAETASNTSTTNQTISTPIVETTTISTTTSTSTQFTSTILTKLNQTKINATTNSTATVPASSNVWLYMAIIVVIIIVVVLIIVFGKDRE